MGVIVGMSLQILKSHLPVSSLLHNNPTGHDRGDHRHPKERVVAWAAPGFIDCSVVPSLWRTRLCISFKITWPQLGALTPKICPTVGVKDRSCP